MIPTLSARGATPEEMARRIDRRRPPLPLARRVALRIVEAVRRGGDRAVLDWQERLGGVRPRALRIGRAVMRRGLRDADPRWVRSLRLAYSQILRFHRFQGQRPFELKLFKDGSRAGQRIYPLDRVGLYVPAGPRGYPSTVLMGAAPAHLAGVRELVVATPPEATSGLPPVNVLAAAAIAGVSEIVVAGGAQAIAALAYGSESVRPVDRIVGPGNAYVTAAKLLCQAETAIDGVAGPSEVVILADDQYPADWIAGELIAQAEHADDAWGGAILLEGRSASEVRSALRKRLRNHPRRDRVEATLDNYGWLATGLSRRDAIELANRLAPEHLSLGIRRARSALQRIRSAGCVFVGPTTPVPMGDYGAGTNHILPTLRFARARGALGVRDFQREVSFLELREAYIASRAAPAIDLARSEGFLGHAEAIELRRSSSRRSR